MFQKLIKDKVLVCLLRLNRINDRSYKSIRRPLLSAIPILRLEFIIIMATKIKFPVGSNKFLSSLRLNGARDFLKMNYYENAYRETDFWILTTVGVAAQNFCSIVFPFHCYITSFLSILVVVLKLFLNKPIISRRTKHRCADMIFETKYYFSFAERKSDEWANCCLHEQEIHAVRCHDITIFFCFSFLFFFFVSGRRGRRCF